MNSDDPLNAGPQNKHTNRTGSNRVIRNYLMIAGIYTLSASVIWGVNTLFLLEAGLSILEVFITNAVFTGSMALFEIPTGVLADTRGRRASFLLSVAVLFFGTLGYVWAAQVGGGLPLFSLMSVILGLGYTFYSGAVEAWLVDALDETGYKGQLDRVFARSAQVSGAAMLIGTVGGGLLGNFALSIPYLARSGLLAMVFFIAYFTMHDLGFKPQKLTLRRLPVEMSRVARESITYGWGKSSMRLLILGSLVQSLLMAWGFYAWQPYFLGLLGRELPSVAGVIAAFISLATIAGNTLVNWFTRFCGRRTTLLLWAAGIHSLAIIGVGLVNSFWPAVALYLVAMATTGIWTPVRQAYIHQLVPSKHRATVISFDSLVASGGSVVGQSGLGYLAQVRNLGSGYVVGGLATVLALPIVGLLRRREDTEDYFEGAASAQGACAAQGLPNIASVDTTAVAEPAAAGSD